VSVELVFETHSWSTDNEAGIATGWLDGRLSEQGRHLAAELGRRRRNDGISVVFTSDLGRAVETAEIAFADGTIPVQRDARLRECNYGALNSMPAERLGAEKRRRIAEPYPEGESYRHVVARVRDFLDELARTHDGERVLVIGHAATRWSLDHLLDGAALEDLVEAPFDWREGWLYVVPDDWGTPAR
jgi:broad specificity phosphatase PhoE